MSRKYKNELRLLKAYDRYVETLNKRATSWAKKGYTPVDTSPLSFSDYVANRELFASQGVNTGNITNKIVSMQLYEFNQDRAKALAEKLAEFGITKLDGKKINLNMLKSDGGKKALSALNEALKEQGTDSGYDRANWLTENIYVDSQ